MSKPQGFPPGRRMRRRADFGRAFARRWVAADQRLTVYIRPNGLDQTRLGMSVTRRVGGAVARNRVKRCLREAFRRGYEQWPLGWDLLCVPKPGIEATVAGYSESLHRLFLRGVDRHRDRSEKPRRSIPPLLEG